MIIYIFSISTEGQVQFIALESENCVRKAGSINDKKIDQINVTKVLGLWISEDLSWDKDTTEICRRAYSRMSMLTKLKYAGVDAVELINIYKLYIRSVLEYCSVVWHSTLTEEQIKAIERAQCLTHPVHNRMFPVNPQIYKDIPTRNQEHFVVNRAKSESYRKSAIPYMQRKLKEYVKKQKEKFVNVNHLIDLSHLNKH